LWSSLAVALAAGRTLALDGEWSLYLVGIALDVEAGLNLDGAQRLVDAVRALVPLETLPNDGKWLITVLVTAPSAEAAAWRTYEHVHNLPGAALHALLARSSDAAATEIALVQHSAVPADASGRGSCRTGAVT
jgi:hypothetical protein